MKRIKMYALLFLVFLKNNNIYAYKIYKEIDNNRCFQKFELGIWENKIKRKLLRLLFLSLLNFMPIQKLM